MTNTVTAKMNATPKGKFEHKAATQKSSATGYRDHFEGSRKGKVHELYDKQGVEAAWTLGLKLGLKQSSLQSWFAQWHRASGATNSTATTGSS